MKKMIICSLIAAGLLAGPAAAQSGNQKIDRWSEQGRRATGAAGYVTGYRMCGARCADGMRRTTNRVYDESRRAADRYDDRLRGFGRRIGNRVRGR